MTLDIFYTVIIYLLNLHLQTQGIQIIAVGIGRYVRTYELYNLATDQYHAFHISSYDNLTALAPNIVTKACGGIIITP